MFSFCPQTLVYIYICWICVYERWFDSLAKNESHQLCGPLSSERSRLNHWRSWLMANVFVGSMFLIWSALVIFFARKSCLKSTHHLSYIYRLNKWTPGGWAHHCYFFSAFVLFILCVDVDSMLQGTFYWNGITVGTTWCLSSLFIYWVIQVRQGYSHVEASERCMWKEGRRGG